MAVTTPEETLDPLVGTWKVLQLARGHRGSTDDRLTAWRALAARPQARRLLDLGSGVGTVGLTTLWHLPPDAELVAVEAQALSAGLFRRSLAHNQLEARVTSVLADFREWHPAEGDELFGLITGSPPYIPVGKGLISPHPQKAHARMELRGGLAAYCAAAKPWLAEGGRFAFVMLAQDRRTEEAPVAAGLQIVERTDIWFRAGQDAHIAICVCAHAEEGSVEREDRSLVVRGTDGRWTEAYTTLMFGLRDFPPELRPPGGR